MAYLKYLRVALVVLVHMLEAAVVRILVEVEAVAGHMKEAAVVRILVEEVAGHILPFYYLEPEL